MPLMSGDAWKAFGKRLIFRRGGVVTRYFVPRDPKSAAQLAVRESFKENYVGSLTPEEKELLDALLAHEYLHSYLSGLNADDHSQYFNEERGDLRYSLLTHLHDDRYPVLGWPMCVMAENVNLSQPLPATTPTQVKLDTVQGDSGSIGDAANWRMVVPETGMYLLVALNYIAAGSGRNIVMIYRNGVQFESNEGASDGIYANPLICKPRALVAGDVLTLWAYTSVGGVFLSPSTMACCYMYIEKR